MQITIDVQGNHIQDSVAVGDVAYYVFTDGSGGFTINAANMVEIGPIVSIDKSSGQIVCDTDLFANEMNTGQKNPNDKPFILFSKDNCQNLKSLLGYYSMFRFINTSKDKAELFNVTVDAFESSK